MGCACWMPGAGMGAIWSIFCDKAVKYLLWTRTGMPSSMFRQLSASLKTGLPAENFQVGFIERMPFPDAFADVVLCNSILHFARDEDHFGRMLSELWRVLKPGGMFFCRLGSRIGMTFERVQGNTYVIGDGSEWFLVDEEMLLDLGEKMNAVLVDPLKTTIVQDYRCMTTWVLRKRTRTRS